MKNIIDHYTEYVKRHSTPWCDFKVYRRHRNLKDIFVQALRRLILVNKQKRSQIQKLKIKDNLIVGGPKNQKERDASSQTMAELENLIFVRLQEQEVLTNYDRQKTTINSLNYELDRVYEMMMTQSQQAYNVAMFDRDQTDAFGIDSEV